MRSRRTKKGEPQSRLRATKASLDDRIGSSHPLLKLQRSIGNESLGRLLQADDHTSPIVSDPDSESEKQAERFAEQLGNSAGESLPVDPSNVHIHTDVEAAAAAKSVNAKAFTVGNDIVFGAGQYRPKTHEGWKLIRHELAHVAQQRGSPRGPVQRTPDEPEKSKGEKSATDFGTITMHFNGTELIVSGDNKEIFRFTAYSGRPVRITDEDAKNCGANQVTDSYLSDKRFVGIKDHGPIPEGVYAFSPAAIERFTEEETSELLWAGIKGKKSVTMHGHPIHPGDWGSGRVELHPKKVLEGPCGSAKTRSEFFLHGGSFAGSSGCIDIGGNFTKLADFMKGFKGSVVLTVTYEKSPPSVGFFTGLGGAIAYRHAADLTHGPRLRLGTEFAPTGTRGVASLEYDAIIRWAGGAAAAGLRLDVPFTDKEAFVRVGLSTGVNFRIFRALHGELFGGYSWEISGPERKSGWEVGGGLQYDFGRVQLEATYNALRVASQDERVHQALIGLGFRFP